MKIKVVAHTSNEEGAHVPGEILDMREATALIWIKNGWAIARPDLEEKKPDPPPAKPERAVIETPEDHSAESKRETAALKHKKK
jgi:hypothetical protein